jgi:CheY-like chemotaxis protein
VTVRRTDETAEIVVRDSGAGMQPGDVARMFEPFVQAQTAPGRALGGLGLGLALTKGLAEAHGGSVSARSEGPGRGLEVVLALPATPEPSREAEPAVTSPAPHRSLSVVVIEDDADVRDSLADLLRLESYCVHTAADGRTGIDLARAVRPDVVLCDLGLPDMSGCEVAVALRSDPEVAGCTLVALSGFAQPEDVARAMAAGFGAHLPKPPSLERLHELLTNAVGRRR